MGRELRKVPADWQHPKDKDGWYKPLFNYLFSKQLAKFHEGKLQWELGYRDDWNGGWKPKEPAELKMSWEEWDGEMPKQEDYMPEWPDTERTHIQLYETTSEGTPLSPLFKADELDKLCDWAADNATTFADYRASASEWKTMLQDGLVYHNTGRIIFT